MRGLADTNPALRLLTRCWDEDASGL